MTDKARQQSEQMRKERRAFIEEVSHEQWVINCKRKKYPHGSTFMFALTAAYGPIGSASRIEKASESKEQAA